MRGHYSVSKRLMAAFLCVAMLAVYLPVTALSAAAPDNRTVDPHTLDQWKNYFGVMDGSYNNVKLTTEYAGGVWTDKSVFSAADLPTQLTDATYQGKSFEITDQGDNFVVSLSALASNKEVVGYSTIPTDTVMVLDLSSSMRTNDDNDGSAIDELVEATNNAITQLQRLNKNNRVAVVLYAGNTAGSFSNNPGIGTVVLPMDTYTPANDGTFLKSVAVGRDQDYAIEVTDGVLGSKGAVSGKLETARGTFTQDGIYEGMRVLLGVEDTKVTEGIQTGTTRLPIMVLMTDGEPTLANRDYNGNDSRTDLGNSEIYLKFNNQDYNHRDTIAWLTQLTAAFAKREVSQHYDNNALFYTLGFGEESTRLEEARSVLDPAHTSNALNGFWNTFLSGGSVNVYTYQEGRQTRYYTTANDTAEPLTAADKVYVDRFFEATGTGSGSQGSSLYNAFASIVEEIKIQSKYYPTYVEKDHDHDGYLTFVDKIGEYMEVTDVKGIILGERLFSGEALAASLANGSFGSIQTPNSRGDSLVQSVKERLGITDTQVAQALLQSAYNHGQLAYNSQTGEFSHYIGWYSDANGNYLDFWHEGMTDAQKPAGATHIIKSYGFLGDTTVIPGISATDMMYMTVRVTKEIATGDAMITWRIPASLVPTVTYEVSVDVDAAGKITKLNGLQLSDESAEHPIRLVYETALRRDIHDWNLAEKVPQSYVNSTENKAAGYVFYTNKWTSSYQDTARNTYSHFEPSVQNERYYFTQDATVYVKNGDSYTPYTGTKPSGSGYYRNYACYELLTNGSLRMHDHYEEISAEAMTFAEADGTQWIIPKDTVHRYYDAVTTTKEQNETGTMAYSDHPFVNAESGAYYTYSTQGNNGMLTMTPATGIRLTKTLAEGFATNAAFTFRLSGNIANAQVVRLTADGDEASRSALPASGEFTLTADETVYIVGLTAGSYTVEEVIAEGAGYSVSQVKVDGAAITGTQANVTLTDRDITQVAFTNDETGFGNLYITKEMESEHNIPQNIAAETFAVAVNVGAALAGKTFTVAYGQNRTLQATVDAAGYLKVNGNHLQIPKDVTYEILSLPEGTQATVTELLTAAQSQYYTTAIATRDHTGAEQEQNNTAVIFKNANATAVITNTYTPKAMTVDLDVEGTKNFLVDTALTGDVTFTFAVQQLRGADWPDMTAKTATVSYGASDGTGTLIKHFRIDNVLEGISYTAVGTYSYRVVEKIPDARAPGVTYDRTLYSFTVSVTDQGGALVAAVTDYNDVTLNGSYAVSFTNSYNTAPVSVDVSKQVDNKAHNPEATANTPFTFVVSATDSSFQSNGHTYEKTIHGEGLVRFTNNFNTPGEYFATVHEKLPAGATLVTAGDYAGMYYLNGWYYDATVWYLHVVVTEQSGDLTAVVQAGTDPAALSGTTDSVSLSFSNVYNPEKAVVGLTSTVKKEISGRELLDGEFTFYVTENNNPSNILLTGTNDAHGNVTFGGTLRFDAIGTYHYDVVEKQVNGNGVTCDPTVYDLVVEVTDNGDGTLAATYYFEDSVTNQVTFHNSYKTDATSHIITATKTLEGRPMLNGEFAFRLVEVADMNGTAKPGGLVLTAENGPATGNSAVVTFPTIDYTTAGTYYYYISEVEGPADIGVTYSTDTYLYGVKVEDNGQGSLVVTDASVVAYNGSAANLPGQMTFRNTYRAQKTQTTVTTFKELTGKVLGDGEFQFLITQTEADFETPVAGGFTETVSNDVSGVLHFGLNDTKKMEYDMEGTYYYVITEDASAAAGGIVYDNSQFLVTVTVVDNHRGVLEATTSIQKKTIVEQEGQTLEIVQPVSTVIFYNRYDPKPITYTPVVKKIYEGEAMKTFDFVLEGTGFQTQTKQNDKNGNVTFDALTFTQAGTYTFTVREKENTLWGFIKWDTNVYTLTVEVEDPGDGQLKIKSQTITSENGRNDLVFHNVHEDLILTKDVVLETKPTVSIDGKQAKQGDVLIYTITYTNYTGKTADVTITDAIPGYTEYVVGSADDGGVFTAGKIVWKMNAIAPGASVTVSFKVKVTGAQGVVKNQAQVLEGVNTYKSNEVEVELKTPVTPETGDGFNAAIFIGLMILSSFGIAAIMVCKKQEKVKQEAN